MSSMSEFSPMDSYLDYLKKRVAEVKRKRPVVEWRFAEAEFNRALEYARKHGLTERYLTPRDAQAEKDHERAVAFELWLQRHADQEEWARERWIELTASVSWSPESRECLAEARKLISEGKK